MRLVTPQRSACPCLLNHSARAIVLFNRSSRPATCIAFSMLGLASTSRRAFLRRPRMVLRPGFQVREPLGNGAVLVVVHRNETMVRHPGLQFQAITVAGEASPLWVTLLVDR